MIHDRSLEANAQPYLLSLAFACWGVSISISTGFTGRTDLEKAVFSPASPGTGSLSSINDNFQKSVTL